MKRYNFEGIRTTDCCGSMSTYHDNFLICKNCYEEVELNQGDGNESVDPCTLRFGELVTWSRGHANRKFVDVMVRTISGNSVQYTRVGGGFVSKITNSTNKYIDLIDELPSETEAAMFGFDEATKVYPGRHNPHVRWNGWAVPYFTQSISDEMVADDFFSGALSKRGDNFVFKFEDDDEEIFEPVDLMGDGNKLYEIGSGSLCWDDFWDRADNTTALTIATEIFNDLDTDRSDLDEMIAVANVIHNDGEITQEQLNSVKSHLCDLYIHYIGRA